MIKRKSPFDSKQRHVQQIYKEKLKQKSSGQKEKRNIGIFIGVVLLGFLALAIFEQVFR